MYVRTGPGLGPGCPSCGVELSEGGLLDHLRSDTCAIPSHTFPAGELPERRTQETVTAWKRAHLLMGPDGGFLFSGVMSSHRYGLDAEAIHVQSAGGFYGVTQDHPSPDPTFQLCHVCGFYGMNKETYLAELGWEFGDWTVGLEVELSGTIIAYERGYRAQHQRVLAVWVDRTCYPCGFGLPGKGRPAEGLKIAPNGLVDTPVFPGCSACCTSGLMSLSEVAGLLGTEVRWRPDS